MQNKCIKQTGQKRDKLQAGQNGTSRRPRQARCGFEANGTSGTDHSLSD
uniref:Uncharacterized protein n=1 Tax=Siphoviridae sp. ctFRY1 TaxID=2827820 RepID=A0A8S5SUN4_9CAUD|nr:MAG TPA: hypothetical protein [Siphoviridae sp. ctFRY1]